MALWLCPLAVGVVLATPADLPSIGEIFGRMEALHADGRRDLQEWVFLRYRTVEEPVPGGAGRWSTALYRVVPREGWDEEVLLRVNGHAPTAAQFEWMRRKNEDRERSARRRGRRVETERPTAGGTSGSEWREEGEAGMEAMLVRLLGFVDARITGRETFRDRLAYRAEFAPRPGVATHGEVEKIASSARGTAWVDADELHFLRVDGAITAPVRLKGGLVRVRTLTFSFENQRLREGLWFPREISYQWEARAGFKTVRRRIVDHFSDFRRAQTYVETEYGGPAEADTEDR